jgi:hypothetical protein
LVAVTDAPLTAAPFASRMRPLSVAEVTDCWAVDGRTPASKRNVVTMTAAVMNGRGLNGRTLFVLSVFMAPSPRIDDGAPTGERRLWR